MKTSRNIGAVKRIAKASFKKLVKEYPEIHENYGRATIMEIMFKASYKLAVAGHEMTSHNECDMKKELIEFNKVLTDYLMKNGQQATLELIAETKFFDDINWGCND